MSGKPTHDTPPIQSLDRGLAILEAVAASPTPVPLKQASHFAVREGDPQDEIVASVGISSPVTRLRRPSIARAAAEVVATARAISASPGD